MSDSTKVRLLCIVIGDDLRVQYSSFLISVPLEEVFGCIIGDVMVSNPSLKGVDHRKFRFYKLPSGHPIRDSNELNGFQLTEEHLTNPLLVSSQVNEAFREEKGANSRSDIDVVIRISFGEHGTGAILHPLPAKSSNSFLKYVTFELQTFRELQIPSDSLLDVNNVTEFPKDKKEPDFILQLEQELHLPRFPDYNKTTLPLLEILKTSLGDGAFGEHFKGTNDGSEMRPASTSELLHYVNILGDNHLSEKGTYKGNKERHVYSILSRCTDLSPPLANTTFRFGTPWAFGLAVKVPHESSGLFQYVPRSDFSISLSDLPHLLLEVNSDAEKKRDMNRMLLQASCLVRLGNALLANSQTSFFVKAIYIDGEYEAIEYTLFQRGTKPYGDAVEYSKVTHRLSVRVELFKFVFRLYNLYNPIRALHQQLSSLTSAVSSIKSATEAFPRVTAKRPLEESTDRPSKRRSRQTTGESKSATEGIPQNLRK
ncbi:hypothetical protein EDB85DRAFT_2154902 [Lactarius pseudohatsudake]|nr:hypothetical protein EDB85DRAFT_2154902 [Lactarius pseudohatsudake]